MYALVEPVLDIDVRHLCYQPYPGHPKGCPNFGKKDGCPPSAPLLSEVMDLSKPVWAIWNAFDFAAHKAKMKANNPTWSERQLACCLYWQPRARKELAEHINKFTEINGKHLILRCPEACGVDITSTMSQIGVILEWPPRTVTYQVALAGTKKEGI